MSPHDKECVHVHYEYFFGNYLTCNMGMHKISSTDPCSFRKSTCDMGHLSL